MPWTRVDDGFYDHPKVEALGAGTDAAIRVWMLCLTYCARHLTDGRVPHSVALRLGGPNAKRGIAALLRVGLWELDEDTSPAERQQAAGEGYRIHDYLDYNPSRTEWLADQEAKHSIRIAGGKARASSARRGVQGRFVPAQQDPSSLLASAGLAGHQQDISSVPYPYPTRPVPGETLQGDSLAGANGSGASSALGISPEDRRYPVAALLVSRFRFRAVSSDQWDMLAEAVDNEYPSGTSKGADPRAGWVWMAEWMRELPRDAGEPIGAFLRWYNGMKAERLAANLSRQRGIGEQDA